MQKTNNQTALTESILAFLTRGFFSLKKDHSNHSNHELTCLGASGSVSEDRVSVSRGENFGISEVRVPFTVIHVNAGSALCQCVLLTTY